MEVLIPFLLLSTCTALPTTAAQTPAIPLVYNYGGYPRIQADIAWGTQPQKTIPTIFDTGSVGFWTFGPNSTINDGSQYHFSTGPCNKKVTNFYNWPASSTHSKPINLTSAAGYSYGGNGKIVSAYQYINDTFSFGNTKWPGLPNNQVALANYTMVAQLDDKCAIPESDYDHSIMGLAPFGVGGSFVADIGPSFRTNMYNQGKTKSRSFSMWFDAPSKSAKGQYHGTSIFGAVPSKSKYAGDLVRIKVSPPKDSYIGYYAAIPKLSATSISKPGAAKTIPQSDKSVKQCLIDSGTGEDRLPFNSSEVIKATGLINYMLGATTLLAYNGTCDSIPQSATLNFTFPGQIAGKKVTVAVPIRSYARGQYDELPGISKKVCPLSLSLDEPASCTFGAPFFTAAFIVFNDDKSEIAMAQGGVSSGSESGPSGLGPVTAIEAKQSIPGAF